MSDTTQDSFQSPGPLGRSDDATLLARILETSPVGITVVDSAGRISFANRKAEQILGLSRSEITNRVYNDPDWRITALDGGLFPDKELPFQKVRDTGGSVEDVCHAIVWPDGTKVCLSISASPLIDDRGGFAGIVAAIVDITAAYESERALKRQKRANMVLTKCNEILVHITNEPALLQEICRIAVEDGGYSLAWVGYAEDGKNKKVRPAAQCGFEDGYLDTITVTWDETETGLGPTGTAIRTGKPACSQNILSDSTYAPWRDEARKRGYASSIALPLMANSKVLGALNIYAAEPDAFDTGEELLLRQMADDLAYGIVTVRMREERTRVLAQLREAREDWQRIFNAISDPVMVLDLDQNILVANPATEKKLGVSLDRILGRKCYEVFHQRDKSAEGCPFCALIQTGGAVEIGEMELEAVAGTFMVTVSPIFNAQGKLSKVLHIAKDITESKQVEQILRDERDKFAIIAATVPGAICTFRQGPDGSSSFPYASSAILDIYGLKPEDLAQDASIMRTLIHPDDYEHVRETITESARSLTPWRDEFRFRHPEKGEVWIESNFMPVRESDGGTIWQGIITDITDRKLAERALAESKERYRLLVDSSPYGIGVHQDGKLVFANSEAARILGAADPSELIGKTVDEIVCPQGLEAAQERIRRMLHGEVGLYPVEDCYVRVDGSHIPVEVIAAPFVFKGRPAMQVIAQDITNRKLAEAAHKESETKLLAIFEQSRDAIGVSKAGVHVMVNPAHIHLFGYEDEDELLGTPVLNLIAPSERDRIRENVRLRAAGVEVSRNYESRGLRKDGTEFDMDVSISTYEINDEIYTLAILRDISERKTLEESLRQAQKMESVGRLAGGVAHDFNNFLTAVEGYIDLALLSLPDHCSERENLLEARHSADRAANLTRQLLLFSRREPLKLKLVNLNTIVKEILKMLERLIGEQYSISSSFDKKLPAVKADAGQIEQVLMNLLVNARDAMAGGGKIFIGTEKIQVTEEYMSSHTRAQVGEYARLYVQDMGSGMDADTLSHIFEPFFSTKEAGVGTGLGLSVVYGIVVQHGGWIDVESRPGSGSTFSVFLPVSPISAEDEAVEIVPADQLSGKGEKILLVEDDESVRMLAEKMLSSNNYSVVSASSAEEGLEMFEKEGGEFDLVFSDVVLPGMNGIKLIERLSELKPELRVLLATGFVEGLDFQVIDEKGYCLLEKPYALTDLLLQVRELLNQD